jgi:iron complex outermembrane receptor protein
VRQSRYWLAAGCALAAMTAAVPALAQQPAPQQSQEAKAQAANEDEGNLVEEVIVTTERRATNIQETPLAVTAFTDKTRELLGIESIQSLAQFSPGVSYSAAADRPTIRGVGRQNNSHGLNSPVAQYVDGVYVSTVQDAARRPIFVDRVEIVSGPQGALAGKGSAAGAIYTYLKRPKDTFAVDFGGLAENYGRWGVEGTITGPVTDWLNYRVNMARYKQEQGFFRNLEDNHTEGTRFGNRTLLDIMFQGSAGKFDYFLKGSTVDYNESLRDSASFAPISVGGNTNPCIQTPYVSPSLTPSNAFGVFQPGSATSCGAFSTGTTPFDPMGVAYGAGITTNPPAVGGKLRDFVSDYHSTLGIDGYYSLTFDTTYHAPGMDIRYIVGRSRYHYTQTSDADGSPIISEVIPGVANATQNVLWNPAGITPITVANRTVNANGINTYEEEPSWYSNELTFASTWGGPLQAILGIYQYNQYTKQPTATITYPGFGELGAPYYAAIFSGSTIVRAPSLAPANELGPVGQRGNQLTRQNTYAAFTQWDYKFNDKWSITAGLRYNYDRENAIEMARDIANNPAVGGGANSVLAQLYGTNFLPTGQVINGPFAVDVSGAFFPGFAVISPSTTGAFADLPPGYRYIDPSTLGAPTVANSTACPAGNVNYLYLLVPVCGNQRIEVGPGVKTLSIDSAGNRVRTEEGHWQALTGGLSINYKPNNNTLLYLHYAKGYRPGGFGAVTAGFLPLNPYAGKESLDTYELGAKITLWQRLQLDMDLFDYDYKNIQVQLSRFERCLTPGDISSCTAVSSVVNLPSGVNRGFEVVGQWYATDNLQFVFNYGYLDAHVVNGLTADGLGFQDTNDPAALLPNGVAHRLHELTCVVASSTCVGGFVIDPITRQHTWTQDPSGNTLPNAPKHKIAANVNYTFDTSVGKFTASYSYIWRSMAFMQGDLFEEGVAATPRYEQSDARLIFKDKDARFQIIVFGTNIFDQNTYESNNAIRRGSGFTPAQLAANGGVNPAQQQLYYPAYVLLPPRTFGVEFLTHFR